MSECVVCMESKTCLNISCNHCVCSSCYIKSGNKTCPCCRKEIHDGLPEEVRDLAEFVLEQNKKYKLMEEEKDLEYDELYEEFYSMYQELLLRRAQVRKAKWGLKLKPQVKI